MVQYLLSGIKVKADRIIQVKGDVIYTILMSNNLYNVNVQ